MPQDFSRYTVYNYQSFEYVWCLCFYSNFFYSVQHCFNQLRVGWLVGLFACISGSKCKDTSLQLLLYIDFCIAANV